MSKDTLELLRECDSGIKMAVGSIDEVSGHIKDEDLKNLLEKSKEEHSRLGGTIKEQLASLGDDGKDPGIMAKSMSWIKTNVKLGMNDSDRTVAGLMTDGCDMGIKSLTRYLNEYKGADGASRNRDRRGSSLRAQTVSVIYLFAGRQHYFIKSRPPRRFGRSCCDGLFRHIPQHENIYTPQIKKRHSRLRVPLCILII